MKIAFVLDDTLDKADGVQQYVITLGQWLTRQGHQVHFLVGNTKRRDIANVHSLSKNIFVRFNQNRMTTPLPASKKLIKSVLQKQNFDVIHVQMPFSPFLAARIIKASDKRTAVVGTFHIIPFSRIEKWATLVLRVVLWRSIRRIDESIAVSSPAKRFAKTHFGSKCIVLPNVVNVNAFNKGKKLKKYNDGKIVIVFLGRLVARKGCMQLLQAIKILHDQRLTAGMRFVICGKGPDEVSLKAFVTKNRLTKCIQFEGFVSEAEKPDYLASADVAIFPSTGGESFGIVLIEAMAARSGVVLGGNNAGYRSVLRDKPNQLFDAANPEAIARVLKTFCFNAPLRNRANKWQEKHINNYDTGTVGPKLLSLYNQTIAKKLVKEHNTKDV